MSTFSRFLFQALVMIVVINVIGLWMMVFFQQRQLQSAQLQQDQITQRIAMMTPAPSTDTVLLPMDTAHATVSAQLAVVTKRLDDVEQKVEKSSMQTAVGTTTTVLGGPREVVVFLGSGSSFDTAWKDIESAVLTLDSAKYPRMKEVRFEAALSILSGNASARLVEKTTGNVIAFSELTHNSSTSTWVVSQPITLLSGVHTYRVQLRSSSNETVQMAGARLRIVLE